MNKVLGYSLMTVAGGLAGYAWWYWYGCVEGCSITSVWWRSSAYGAVLGYLTGDLFIPQMKKGPATPIDTEGVAELENSEEQGR